MDYEKLQKGVVVLTLQLVDAIDKYDTAHCNAAALEKDLSVAQHERAISLQNFECLVRDGRVKANEHAQLSIEAAELKEQNKVFQHTLRSIVKAAAMIQLQPHSTRHTAEFVTRVIQEVEAVVDCSTIFALLEEASNSPEMQDLWNSDNIEAAAIESV